YRASGVGAAPARSGRARGGVCGLRRRPRPAARAGLTARSLPRSTHCIRCRNPSPASFRKARFAVASAPPAWNARMADDAQVPEYLVLSRGQWRRDATPDEIQAAIDDFYAWLDAHVAAGRMKTGHRLAREGATIWARGVALDGPFGETKELVGGYWFVVAPSLAEAAALLSSSPTLPLGLRS